MSAKQVCRNVLGLATCALFILALGSAPAFAVESTTFPNPNKRSAPEAIKQAPAAQGSIRLPHLPVEGNAGWGPIAR